MKHLICTVFIFFLIVDIACAQEVSSRVVDSITKEPIPFATVIFKNHGTVSNEEGSFSFIYGSTASPNDTLRISCIGYKTIAEPLTYFKDPVISMAPQIDELDEVILVNTNYDADEIIEKVKDNLDKNYNFNLSKKRLFFREGNHQNFIKFNYELKKSTIDAFNKKFIDSLLQALPRSNSYYTEVLCDIYGNLTKEKQKIDVIKASEMYNKNNEVSLKAMEKKFNEIIKENVKEDSYFKIKSGIFGNKVEGGDIFGKPVDSSDVAALQKDKEEREKKRKENFALYRKNAIAGLLGNLFFLDDAKPNVISKSRKYEFEKQQLTHLGDDAVYVVNFQPKGGADYKGVLYINVQDFAVLRVDYENVKPLKTFGLLGISFKEYLHKGKMIFARGKDGKYNLKYLETEGGSQFGVDRPLKIIEKNKNTKGRRRQNELYAQIDMAMNNTDKRQIVVFDTANLSDSGYTGFKENNQQLPTYLAAYDPEFWKGYNIIEPNQAIKDFTALEQSSEK